MGRAPCCDKATVKKGPWSPEEDAKLKSFIEQHGTGGNWITLPKKIGLRRCGKSCRLRWLNYLRPNLKHGGYSDEEDKFIYRMYTAIGSRWSIIASQLAGRTDNDVKNYWNTKLKKKFLGKQRKEYPAPRKQRKAKKEEDDLVAISGQQQQQQPPLDGAGNSFAMPPPLLASQQQIYDLVPPPLQESQGLGSDDGGPIWSELDEMLRFSWVKLEDADCYYGLGGGSMVNDGSSNYTTEKSENMEEVMSPSLYQNMMRVYDHGMQGFMPPAQGAEDAPWHVTMS